MKNTSLRVLRWLKRGTFTLIIALLVVAMAGFILQSIATQSDQTQYPPEGELITVDGYQMHLDCVGEGSPTVILEAGLGLNALSWSVIQPQLAEHTRVCAYDRAGLGWSEGRPEARTAEQLAIELRALLDAAQINDEILFVAHSFGGLIVRQYTAAYPENITGIIMVDALQGEEYSPACGVGCFSPEMMSTVSGVNQALSFAANFGLTRLAVNTVNLPMFEVAQTMPEALRPAVMASLSTAQHWQTNAAEFTAIGQSAKAALDAPDFGATPLIVLSADSTYTGQSIPGMTSNEAAAVWMQAQTLLAQLSTNSKHIVVQGATHNSMLTNPEHSAQVVSAVLNLLAD